jgi:hypothetical protein
LAERWVKPTDCIDRTAPHSNSLIKEKTACGKHLSRIKPKAFRIGRMDSRNVERISRCTLPGSKQGITYATGYGLPSALQKVDLPFELGWIPAVIGVLKRYDLSRRKL